MKNIVFCISVFILLNGLCVSHLAAQDKPVTATVDSIKPKIIKWWQILQKPPRPAKKGTVYFIPIPIFSVNPTASFQFGVGATLNWFNGEPVNTRISGATFGISYTLKKQLISSLKTTIYTQKDNWKFSGDWRYQISSQPGFGTGTGHQSATLATPAIVINDNPYGTQTPGVKVITYNFARVYETAFRRVVDKFYMGVGYHLDYYYHVNDQLLNLNVPDPLVTAYYSYNVKYGFNQTTTITSGVSVDAEYDMRDNQNNPHKGRYASLSFRYNPTF